MELTQLHLQMIQEALGTMGSKICEAIVVLAQKAEEYDKLIAEISKQANVDKEELPVEIIEEGEEVLPSETPSEEVLTEEKSTKKKRGPQRKKVEEDQTSET